MPTKVCDIIFKLSIFDDKVVKKTVAEARYLVKKKENNVN